MIRGFFRAESRYPLPIVEVHLSLPTLGLTTRQLEFVVDTGASTSCLHPIDAVAMGLALDDLDDPTRWDRAEFRGGVGGASRYFIVPASCQFEDDSGPRRSIEGEMRIAQFTSANAELPSLLAGMFCGTSGSSPTGTRRPLNSSSCHISRSYQPTSQYWPNLRPTE